MDKKRTLLLSIFMVSFLLLADNWMRYNGLASIFMLPSNHSASPENAAKNLAAITNVASANTTTATLPNAANPHQTAEIITLDTPLYVLKINTQGGVLEDMQLKKYAQTMVAQSQAVHIFEKARRYSARLGLVNGPNHTHVYQATSNDRILKPEQKELRLTLEAVQNNLKVQKTFILKPNSYVIDVNVHVENMGQQAVQPELYAEIVRDHSVVKEEVHNIPFGGAQTFTGAALYTTENAYQKLPFKDIAAGTHTLTGTQGSVWVAMIQHYFVSSWYDNAAHQKNFYAQNLDENTSRIGFKTLLPNLSTKQSADIALHMFAGPQNESVLKDLSPGLELVKDYGWAAIFAKPLFWLLEKIHGFVGNWGWAIILLTVLLKMLFYPLTASSQKSLEKMKILQPKMTELRTRYAQDPQKMNQELLKLYRESKANPMGGCLPILIQMPVFFALYYVLLSSVEMRHAPWLGWIHDLSAPDPWFILPVLMAISMFVQIKLNPKPADPMQAKLMLLLPMLFSVTFLFFPAGLVLYYVVNNILSILQSRYIQKQLAKHAADDQTQKKDYKDHKNHKKSAVKIDIIDAKHIPAAKNMRKKQVTTQEGAKENSKSSSTKKHKTTTMKKPHHPQNPPKP